MKLVHFCLSTLVAVAALAPAQTSPAGYVGKRAPAFSVTTLDGAKLTSAGLKGKVVLLDFWATWCSSCLKAGPTMEKLHKAYSSKGLVVLGLNAKETKPRPAASANLRKQHGYTYQMVSDGDVLHKAFKAEGLPIIAVIGKDGKVKAVFDDFDPLKTPALLESAVKAAL